MPEALFSCESARGVLQQLFCSRERRKCSLSPAGATADNHVGK